MNVKKRSFIPSLLMLLTMISQSLSAAAMPCLEMHDTDTRITYVASDASHSEHGMETIPNHCDSVVPTECTTPVTHHDCCDNQEACPMIGLIATSLMPVQHTFVFKRGHGAFVDFYSAVFHSVSPPSLFRPPIV